MRSRRAWASAEHRGGPAARRARESLPAARPVPLTLPPRRRYRPGVVPPSARPCLLALAALAGCTGEPAPAPTQAADTGPGATDGADGATADSGWPDQPPDWSASVSLVHDGAVVGDGAEVVVQTAPAGLDRPAALAFTLTNRSGAALSLSADPADWLSGDGWALASAPPTALEPEASATFSLEFSPADVTTASSWPATLTVPGALSVSLRADVPRPLRAVVVADGHLTWVTDDYGATFTEVVPWDGTAEQARSVAWGDGRFFRAGRDGGEWSSPGTYAWSEDGAAWTPSTYADAFWVSGCGWGFSRFTCLRAAMYTWSLSGETVVHEADTWSSMLHDQVWLEDRFVAVGRDGRRAWATSVEGFSEGDWYDAADDYNAVATDGARVVAVGGSDRLLVSWSDDGGATWGDAVLCAERYARFEQVAHNPVTGTWLATASSNGCARAWSSADGEAWAPVDSTHSVVVLGVVGGSFVGVTNEWGSPGVLVVSADGATWEERATAPAGVAVRDLAVEDR